MQYHWRHFDVLLLTLNIFQAFSSVSIVDIEQVKVLGAFLQIWRNSQNNDFYEKMRGVASDQFKINNKETRFRLSPVIANFLWIFVEFNTKCTPLSTQCTPLSVYRLRNKKLWTLHRDEERQWKKLGYRRRARSFLGQGRFFGIRTPR